MYIDEEKLRQLGITGEPRDILARERVTTCCGVCSSLGESALMSILNTHKNTGHGWRCKKCVLPSVDRSSDISSILEHWSGNIHPNIKRNDQLSLACKICGTEYSKPFRKFLEGNIPPCFGCLSCFKTYRNSPEYIEKWRNSLESKIPSIAKKSRDRMVRLYAENPEKKYELTAHIHTEEAKKKSAESRIGWFDRLPEEGKEKVRTRIKSVSHQHRAKSEATCNERYGGRSPFSSKEVREKARTTWNETLGVDNPFQSPEIRKKAFGHQHDNRPSRLLSEFLENRGFDFVQNYTVNDKDWDFAIFKNGQLDLLIEIDGEYFHGHTCDPFYKQQRAYEYDNSRLSKSPDGVKVLLVDSDKVKDAVPEILGLYDISYEKWTSDLIEECLSSSFPYPSFSEKRMVKDWENLCRISVDKYHPFLMTGNSIVTNFHKSIYTSNKEGHPSPVEAWNNPVLLKKCVENRVIYCRSSEISSYHIARGFEKNRIAPRVSVFQPSLARYLLMKYGVGGSVIDPFSGFSGRLLGAASLGMSYRGVDIRREAVDESNSIIEFLGLDNVSVSSGDSSVMSLSGDTLLTCPPYGNKEIWTSGQVKIDTDDWIDLCLSNNKAERYIFVVDKTDRFPDNIVETLDNKSHFGMNSELVLVF